MIYGRDFLSAHPELVSSTCAYVQSWLTFDAKYLFVPCVALFWKRDFPVFCLHEALILTAWKKA